MTNVKPFSAAVNASGQGIVVISHSLQGMTWKVLQIGFGLTTLAPSPQVAAHVNGLPLASTVTMQPTVFANIQGQAPYAMETFFVGPPYINIDAGDSITCAVLGANPGDSFVAAAYIEEFQSDTVQPLPVEVTRPRRW